MSANQARWVDSHCHLFATEDTPEEVLDRATAAGVEWLMCPGIDLETSLRITRSFSKREADKTEYQP